MMSALGLWWWLCFTMVLAALGGAPGALRGGAAARMIHSKASEVVSVRSRLATDILGQCSASK
jgi:hypothetical protein